MKNLKIFLIVILLLFMMSCYLINDNEIYDYIPKVEISSINIFSINGKIFTKTTAQTPFTLYNPNLYAIIITIDEIEHIIPSHNYLTINTPKGERSNLYEKATFLDGTAYGGINRLNPRRWGGTRG